MSNKSTGTAFEKELAELFAARGFWVHRLQDSHSGQPFDLIAVKDNYAVAIDCKDCQGDSFRLDRLEGNQRSAMDLWMDCGNEHCFFAVNYREIGVYLFPYKTLREFLSQNIKQIKQDNAKYYGLSLDRWEKLSNECNHECND